MSRAVPVGVLDDEDPELELLEFVDALLVLPQAVSNRPTAAIPTVVGLMNFLKGRILRMNHIPFRSQTRLTRITDEHVAGIDR